MATTYNNDVPSGLTLLAWSVNPNNGGKSTSLNFIYSGGFNAPTPLNIPFDSSWHTLDDVRPILLAEQEGYGNYLGGTNGSFGSNIKFSDNVLAAMKVQNFNPSQVGGANIPPSSTTLTANEIAWLQKGGYSVTATSTPTTTPTPTPVATPVPATQPQPESSQQTVSTQTNASSKPAQKVNTSSSKDPVTSDPEVGKTVKTPVKTATPETIAAAKKFATENPPSLNPTNIPINVPVKKETSATRNLWIWIAGVVIFVLVAVAGRIIYVRHRVSI